MTTVIDDAISDLLAFDGDYLRSRYGDDPVIVRFCDAMIRMRTAEAKLYAALAILTAMQDARLSARSLRFMAADTVAALRDTAGETGGDDGNGA